MQVGMIGLGRMGANMAKRVLRGGHDCVVYDRDPAALSGLTSLGATGASSFRDLVERLRTPRAIWLMIPAAVVDPAILELAPLLARDDVLVDGGNSFYQDDIRRAKLLAERGIHYLDVGTSGGVWGLERGYCQMIGGDASIVKRLDSLFAALAPPFDSVPRSPQRSGEVGPAERGYLHCGPSGAGHFVKMIHNGIEYGLMAAYAEGLNILRHANAGRDVGQRDAETAPLRDPEHYQYDLDLANITELWRRGSVIASWLLDLTAAVMYDDASLCEFTGRVSDSGEGRWTLKAAVDEGVPAPVLAVALAERFASRGAEDYANRVLSAMRFQFGGHEEKKSG